MATKASDVTADARAARDAHIVRLTFALVLATSLACSFYASIDARGLYRDGIGYLFEITVSKWFFLFDPARTAVEILRQAPIVFLSKFTNMSFLQLGQLFSFVLLVLPTLLCALCWFIAPRDRKAWILFPLTYLLIGFAPTSMQPIGEAAIATSFFWILLFLLLFRTRFIASQVLFLLLCIPVFQMQEATFPLMGVLLFACAMRARGTENRRERIFLGLSAFLIAAIIVYQVHWIVYPLFPSDRDSILQGLIRFEFLYVDHHLNLPLVTGAFAMLALAATFVVHATRPPNTAAVRARTFALAFALFAVAAIVDALLIPTSFSPEAHVQARYHPVFVSAALGTVIVFLVGLRLPDRLWMQPTTVFILIMLCAAQTAADVAATRHWHAYVMDLQSRLANARGLILWETTLRTGDERRDMNWRLFAVKSEWVFPLMSIVYSPRGTINSIIDVPESQTFRPIDPEKANQLPKLPGINFTPYKCFLAVSSFKWLLDEDPSADAEEISGAFGPPLVPGTDSKVQDAFPVHVRTPAQPFANGAQFSPRVDDLVGPLWIRIRADVQSWPIGIGILNHRGDKFLLRTSVYTPGVATIDLRVIYPQLVGNLVVQSWDQGKPADVIINAITAFKFRSSDKGQVGKIPAECNAPLNTVSTAN
jgi:hypothetical protein